MATPTKDPGEDIRKVLEEEQRNSAVVIERLGQLIKKGVVSNYDLTYAPVISGGRNVPRIVWTVERLLAEGHLAGIEGALKGFFSYVGKGMGAQAIDKMLEK